MEDYVTKTEIARHLHVCTRTVDNMMARNEIPYLILGRIVRFKVGEVDEALAKNHRIASAYELALA